LKKRKVQRRHGLIERLSDTVHTKDTKVHDIGPFGDTQRAAVVLLFHSTTDIDEFAVFEKED
jgi:hypothetical protein